MIVIFIQEHMMNKFNNILFCMVKYIIHFQKSRVDKLKAKQLTARVRNSSKK